jgi:phosphoribosylglycinamide formyltransferase 2
VKIFNKPGSRPYRRMGVVLCNDRTEVPADQVKEKAKALAAQIRILS